MSMKNPCFRLSQVHFRPEEDLMALRVPSQMFSLPTPSILFCALEGKTENKQAEAHKPLRLKRIGGVKRAELRLCKASSCPLCGEISH